MRKNRKIVSLLLCLISLTSFLFSCKEPLKEGDYTYEHPDYKYIYSEEYHLENLRARTNEIFKEEIESGEIIKVEVETVYAFYDEDPEYFLITLEYEKEIEVKIYQDVYKTNYKHLLGYHFGEGEYYYGVRGYDSLNYGYKLGKSPYHYLGYGESKKYYGSGTFAVEENNKKLKIYSSFTSMPVDMSYETDFYHSYINKTAEKELMLNNIKFGSFKIYKLKEINK